MNELPIRRLAQVAFWVCAVAVLCLALAPVPSIPVSVSSWDKLNHVFAFSVLGLLGLTAWPARRRALMAWLFAYGCMIEVLQLFTPTHESDWEDVVADVVGLLVAVAIHSALAAGVRTWRK